MEDSLSGTRHHIPAPIQLMRRQSFLIINMDSNMTRHWKPQKRRAHGFKGHSHPDHEALGFKKLQKECQKVHEMSWVRSEQHEASKKPSETPENR
jgi:hypothetical protein